MNTAVGRTNELLKHNIKVLIDPKYLTDSGEIGKPLDNGALFFEFHRYIYSLSDEKIDELNAALCLFTLELMESLHDKSNMDYYLIKHTIYFHKGLRDQNWMHHLTCKDLANDYTNLIKSANNYPEVTSQVLIELTKSILKKYSGAKIEFVSTNEDMEPSKL